MKRHIKYLFLLCSFLHLEMWGSAMLAATTSTTSDGFIYYTESGVKYISGYSGSATSITIPSGFQLAVGAFRDQKQLVSVSSLTSVALPDGITKIEDQTFMSCSKLNHVEIPAGVTRIGSMAFYSCSSIKELMLPTHLQSIGNYAFYGARFVTIELPAELQVIGNGAFSSCTSLVSIALPSGIVEVADDAFEGCI